MHAYARANFHELPIVVHSKFSRSASAAAALQGALRAVVAAATLHEKDARCTAVACNVFKSLALAGDGAGGGRVAREGACPVIVDALKNHAGNASVAAPACSAMINLFPHPAGRDILTREGGLTALVGVMKKQEANPDVIGPATIALHNWFQEAGPLGSTEGAERVTAELVRAGAAPLFVSVLRRYGADPVGADGLLRGLQALTASESGKAAIINTCLLPLAQALVSVMRIHADQPDQAVVRFSCYIAVNLTIGDLVVTNEVMIRSGVAAAVLAALRRHPHDGDIAFAACKMLRNMAARDKASREALVRGGAIAAVVAAAPYHTAGVGHEELVLPVLTAVLQNLTQPWKA